MDQIVQILKEKVGTAEGSEASTLSNLSAYLTLSHAREAFGFEPAAYGLSEKEASDIAGVFAQYDRNDDGKIDSRELRQLCSGLGKDLSDEEAKTALQQLDINANGYIECVVQACRVLLMNERRLVAICILTH